MKKTTQNPQKKTKNRKQKKRRQQRENQIWPNTLACLCTCCGHLGLQVRMFLIGIASVAFPVMSCKLPIVLLLSWTIFPLPFIFARVPFFCKRQKRAIKKEKTIKKQNEQTKKRKQKKEKTTKRKRKPYNTKVTIKKTP